MFSKLRHISPAMGGILFVNFIGSLGFSIVIPFLVVLVYRFGGNAFVYGLVGAAYPAFQLVGSPLLGRWSDSWGRRPVLLLSQLGTLLSWIVFAAALIIPVGPRWELVWPVAGSFAVTLPLILITLARAFDGLTGGNVSVAQAYLADISTRQERASSYGTFSIAQNVGFVIGPALAGILVASRWGELLPVLAALLISVVASVYIWGWLPEPKRKETRAQKKASQAQTSFTRIMTDFPVVRWLLVLYVVMFIGFNFFYVSFPVFATQELGWSAARMGLYFAGISVAMVVTQGPILRWASRQWSESWLMVVGTVILSSSFVVIGTGNTGLMILAAGLYALGNGLMWPSFLSILSQQAEEIQGTIQGLSGAAGSLAGIAGMIYGGWLYEQVGATILLYAGALILVSGVVAGWMGSRPAKSRHP